MIAFYISSHGFGHLTRSMVHIKEILEKTDKKIYIACGKKQNDFAKIVLREYDKRLTYKDLITDIGFINKENSLKPDIEKLEKELYRFIRGIEQVVKDEFHYLKDMKLEEVITDISVIGVLLAKKIGVKVTAISNFTWYNQYEYLNLNKKILDFFYKSDILIDKFKVYPLALDLSHIKAGKEDIGFISREIDIEKVKKIRKKYKEVIYIGAGRSANLKKMTVSNYKGVIFYTDGIEVEGEGEHIKLPIEIEDSHNYIAASDFIIAKAGWGTVAEAFNADVEMVLLERPEVLEDTYIISKLKSMKKAISISSEKLINLDINKLRKKLIDLKNEF